MFRILHGVAGAIAPLGCPICNAPTDGPCGVCVSRWHRAPELAIPFGLIDCRAAFAYADGVESVVLSMKRTGRHGLAGFMAEQLRLIGEDLCGPTDLVTWAPTSAARARSRGFDHGEELARAVARRLGLRAVPLLERTSDSAFHGSVIARNRTSFEVRNGRAASAIAGRNVLLVDDVRTTGSTLRAAAAAIHQHRPNLEVRALTFAATPLGRRFGVASTDAKNNTKNIAKR
jgi:predicted amidophosphoribosyltransferase